MNYDRKYSMTKEENLFVAKRNMVDYIWKSANLEGIPVTFPDTATICDGISVEGKSIDDINNIVQLKRGWRYLARTQLFYDGNKTDLSDKSKKPVLLCFLI